jgi:DNA invertase Pin-like site-specific DNA recombinase
MGLVATQHNFRVAIYARHSPKPEGAAGDNFSIASQLDEGRALALRDFGCEKSDEYIDKNVSGASLDRPALDRLRDAVAAKLYDIVIVHSPDRWTRGGEMDSLILEQELKKGGARLVFVSGNYEDSPEGRLARGVQDKVSQYEREKFRERARRCRRRKSREGHPHACHPPDGYKYEGHKFGKKGEYVIVEVRAKIVRLIFTKTAAGMTNAALAIWLNEQGVPTHSAYLGLKTKRGVHVWYPNSVTQVLEKKAYLGVMMQNGEEIRIPPIITRELWKRAHDALALHKAGCVGRPPREYELSGLIWCARCGHRCSTFPEKGEDAAYRCNHIDPANRAIRYCHAPGIRKSVIEPLVWAAIWNAVCDPGLLWQLIEAYHERVSGPPAKKDPVMLRIDRARRNLALKERIFKDPDKPVSYEEAKADLEAARRELAQAQIAGGAAVAVMPLRRDVEAAAAAFRRMRVKLTAFEDRREALQLLVAKILFEEGHAEIHCHLPAAAENYNSCIRGNCNFSGPIPFVISCPIPAGRKRRAA